jgi:hypothetical protein
LERIQLHATAFIARAQVIEHVPGCDQDTLGYLETGANRVAILVEDPTQKRGYPLVNPHCRLSALGDAGRSFSLPSLPPLPRRP